jgi:hypothetical protein
VLCKLVACRGTSKYPKAAGHPYEVAVTVYARHNSAVVNQTDESDDLILCHALPVSAEKEVYNGTTPVEGCDVKAIAMTLT